MDKNKAWPAWIILGAIPGIIIWLFIVKIGYAGEFAGLLIGFGAIALYRYFNCPMKKSRLIIGSLILLALVLITNHLAYSIDVYEQFAEDWYGAAGENYSYFDAIKTVFNSFVLENLENMRSYYIEVAIQGTITTLTMWIIFFIYYIKSDALDREIAEGQEDEQN
jgi:uncharacterized membrane protein